ncbi:glutathione S-transferase D7-like [Vanessa cardui]|uniref:glutathione S-transferase D7-like n=1 Tax=Vanessa cardui TaxID=171605 RepID=UPI001F1408CA|nr:glutathione S-transferase D7-like [Vanessa cardui]
MANKASSLVLYMNEASPPSNAVIMLGSKLGLQFDYKKPSLLTLEHKSPEFKKINPMGTIPVLVDGDFVVSESHAIMKYLLGKYGGDHQEKLYPSDVRTRALIDQSLFYDAGVLFVRLKAFALPTLLRGLDGISDTQKADIDEAFSVVEAYLQKNKYIAADHLTLADISLASTVAPIHAVYKIDEKRFPRCKEWLELLNKEEIFKEINEPGAALFANIMNMFWEKNKK